VTLVAGRGLFCAAHLAELLAVLLAAPAALAAPPDARIAVVPGAPRIERIGSEFTAVEVDEPLVLRAELLPSGELLLEPQKAGATRVFLYAERLVRVLEVAVGQALAPIGPEPSGPCRVAVVTPACYPAWRERLIHLPAAEAPRIAFEIEGLQAEAKAAGERLAAAGLGHVRYARSALGVRLSGARDLAEKRRAVRAIWPVVLGVMRVEESR
jgi:hypothetical protein